VCLAIPAKVIAIESDGIAEVDIEGVRQKASVELVPEIEVGSYVLIHAGFALSVLDTDEAEETLKVFREVTETTIAHDQGLEKR